MKKLGGRGRIDISDGKQEKSLRKRTKLAIYCRRK